MVVLEGLGYKDNVALGGVIRRVRVDLHNAAFGIKVGDFETPQLYLAKTNTHASYDETTGELLVRERPKGQPGRGLHLPKLWLDLPWSYQGQQIGPITINARGYVELNGITTDTLEVDTWDDVMLVGVHIGNTCMARSVGGNIRATGLVAPTATEPKYAPSVELIALTGGIEVAESTGSWRLASAALSTVGVNGPQHTTNLAPRAQAA